MVVAKNSLIKVNEKFDIEDVKKIVEKHVNQNFHKLLQVIINNTSL